MEGNISLFLFVPLLKTHLQYFGGQEGGSTLTPPLSPGGGGALGPGAAAPPTLTLTLSPFELLLLELLPPPPPQFELQEPLYQGVFTDVVVEPGLVCMNNQDKCSISQKG
jgi:hypothetical protein